jgi:hypothetical protein
LEYDKSVARGVAEDIFLLRLLPTEGGSFGVYEDRNAERKALPILALVMIEEDEEVVRSSNL